MGPAGNTTRSGPFVCFAIAAFAVAILAFQPRVAIADPAAHLRRALELREIPGRAAEELAELEQALAYFPSDTPAAWPNRAFLLNERGLAAARAGLPDAARANAAEAVELALAAGVGPDRLAAYRFNAGLAKAAHGDLPSALAFFDAAAADARTAGNTSLSGEAKLQAGRVALRLGDAGGALERLAELDPNAPEVAFFAVEVHLWRRDVAAARSAVARLPGDDPAAVILTARTLIAQGEMDAAHRLLAPFANRDTPAHLRASALYNLAEIDFMRGRFPEAQVTNAAAADAYREAFGDRAAGIGLALHRQALIDQEIGDVVSAAQSYDRTLDFLTETLPEDHPYLTATLVEHSILISRTVGPDPAIETLERIIASAPVYNADYAYLMARAALGLVLHDAGRGDEARENLESVQRERASGNLLETDEPPGLNALAELRLHDGDLAGARAAVQRAIAIQERARMRGVDKLGESRRILAEIEAAAGNSEAALVLARQNAESIADRLIEQARVPTYAAAFAPRAVRDQIGQLLRFLWEISGDGQDSAVVEEMFLAAQLVHLTETTAATNGFMRRVAEGSPETRLLFEQRNRVSGEIAALSRSVMVGPFEHHSPAFSVASRPVELERELQEIDAALHLLIPAAMELLTPKPETSQAVAAALVADEALWLHAVFEDGGYAFLVSTEGVSAAKLPTVSGRLDDLVAELRASVDLSATGHPPVFDWDAASSLHDALFGPLALQIESHQRLTLIPDAAAQQISHAMLVRHAPDLPSHLGAGHPEYRFLGLTHALSVTPSPRALIRLRSVPPRVQTRSFIGIGDPDLRGPETSRENATENPVQSRSLIELPQRLAQPDRLRNLFAPLPETAQELAQMAAVSDVSELYLRDRARESILRAAQLNTASAIAFATHAVVTGDFDNLNEPAIVLTPPDIATSEDDGLLTTSEIAMLDLSAEIVILSACNTGSTSGRPGAAGLSGLASGFFEAGARALVVSHWAIDTNSSLVMLPLFYRLMADEGLSAPTALQRVMWVTANNPMLEGFSHPALWAPFAVVGGD